jgi:hypothetical protein
MTVNLKYEIPDDYFDSLPDRMMQRIEFEENKKRKKRGLVFKLINVSVAAVLCAGIFCAFAFSESGETSVEENSYESLYLTDILGKSGDVSLLYYSSPDEQISGGADWTEVLSEYPSPITISEYYD